MKTFSLNLSKKTNLFQSLYITLLMMLFVTLGVVCLASLPTMGFSQAKKDTTPPVIKIKAPRAGEHFVLPEYRVNLSFTITDDSRLKKVDVEVIGEYTGTYFTICGEDQPPCKGDPPVFEFDLYSPVFVGQNIIKIIALDESENTAEVTTQFHVGDSISEASGSCDESEGVFELPIQLAKKTISLPTPSSSWEEQYDLLILTHKYDFFMGPLFLLTVHKNNTGMPTKLLSLDEIYENKEFRGRDHAETIKKAIAEFKKWWGIKYVMIVGDSDRFPIRYTKKYDLGKWGDGFTISDLYYADLFDFDGNFDSWDYDHDNLFGEMQANFPKDKNDLNQDRIQLWPDVAVGRVPVSNKTELETYVNKVINYETSADSSWFKRGLLITGDYSGSNTTNNYIADQLLSRSFQIVKMYHDQIWPTTNMNERKLMIENELNTGVGFISYVGHGGGVVPGAKDGGGWGGWYDYSKIPFLNNMNKLPVIFSAACNTGEFGFGPNPYYAKMGYEYQKAPFPDISFAKYRWGPEPIALVPTCYDVDALAEHFLVKGPMGGIAFIGSYTGTQSGAPKLAKYFFEAYASGTDILGDLWNAAIEKYIMNFINQLDYENTHSWRTYAEYHHIHKMLLFGDPSLRLGGVLPDLIAVPDQSGNFCKRRGNSLVIIVKNQGLGPSGPSMTEVDFLGLGKKSILTPKIFPGDSQELLFETPQNFWISEGTKKFQITVDVMQEVIETNEGNNIATGACIIIE